MNRRDSCVICNTGVAESATGIEGYRVCRCCDAMWCLAEDPTNPTVEWETDYYGRQDIIQLHESRRSGMVALVDRLSVVCPNRGRLLDVGTGVGIFMHVAAEAGWSVEGVEPSKTAAERARCLTQACVHNGLLEEIDLPDDHYDAITIIDILRSIPDPISFLRAARRVLRPGGIMLIRESDRRVEQAFRWIRKMVRRKKRMSGGPSSRRASTFAQSFSTKSLLFAFNQIGLEGWIEPSPVFVEPQIGLSLGSSFTKQAVGLASTTLYTLTARRLILSPNLLAFGRKMDAMDDRVGAHAAHAVSVG